MHSPLILIAVLIATPATALAADSLVDIFWGNKGKEGNAPAQEVATHTQTGTTKASNAAQPETAANAGLDNASFEQGLSGWSSDNGAEWTPGGGYGGSGALRIQAASPPDDKYIHETAISQCVALKPGFKYTLSARVRLEPPSGPPAANRGNLTWYDSTDCSTGGQFGHYIEPKIEAGWQTLTRGNLTPALGARAALIALTQRGRLSRGGSAYWDDIRFMPSDALEKPATITAVAFVPKAGSNLVINGDFRQDMNGWHQSWQSVVTSEEGDRTPGAAQVLAHSERGGIGRLAFNQCVDLGAERRYQMGASFKQDPASTQSGGGRLRLSWYEHHGCRGRAKIDGHWADPEQRPGWQRLHVPLLVAPATARSAKVTVIQTIDGSGLFSAYWDDVYLKVRE